MCRKNSIQFYRTQTWNLPFSKLRLDVLKIVTNIPICFKVWQASGQNGQRMGNLKWDIRRRMGVWLATYITSIIYKPHHQRAIYETNSSIHFCYTQEPVALNRVTVKTFGIFSWCFVICQLRRWGLWGGVCNIGISFETELDSWPWWYPVGICCWSVWVQNLLL